MNACEADQIPELSSGILLPGSAQCIFQPVRFKALRHESNEEYADHVAATMFQFFMSRTTIRG
jgi:hypothetical protein